MLLTIIIDIIDTIVSSVIKLLSAIDSIKEIAILISLLLIIFIGSFFYQLILSNELIELVTTPRIERIGGYCYQQRIRSNVQIVAIQFPLPKDAAQLGATQNLASYVVVDKRITQMQFKKLCQSLVNVILDPSSEMLLLKSNPNWLKKLQDFYNKMDENPASSLSLPKDTEELKPDENDFN